MCARGPNGLNGMCAHTLPRDLTNVGCLKTAILRKSPTKSERVALRQRQVMELKRQFRAQALVAHKNKCARRIGFLRKLNRSKTGQLLAATCRESGPGEASGNTSVGHGAEPSYFPDETRAGRRR